MAHPNVDKYVELTKGFEAGDMSGAADWLAPDVIWHEAGNPEPIHGAEAVLARLSSMPAGATSKVDTRAILGDDDNLMVVGHAYFAREDHSVGYDYVEHMTVKDGRVTERWSYMDAVPDDVAAFFGAP